MATFTKSNTQSTDPLQKQAGSATATYEALKGEPVHETVINIMRPAQDIYAFWRDLNNLPLFMKHLKSIQVQSPTLSHWQWKALKDRVEVSWDSEITQDIPGYMIAWRTLGDSQVTHAGQVTFEEQPFGRGTFVRVQLAYDPPGGALTHFLEKLMGESSEAVLRDDLRRLRQLMEAGEIATIEGQSRGGLEPKINPTIHH